MKVLVLTPSVSRTGGGVSESTRLLVKSISSRADVSVYSFKNDFTDSDVVAWEGGDPVSYQVMGPKRYGFSFGMLWSTMWSDADIIHVHGLWMFHCLAARVWGIRTGRPYVVTPHGMLESWIVGRSPLLKRVISVAYQNAFLRHAKGFHVLTAKEVEDVKPFSSAPAVVIPNYVDLAYPNDQRPHWWKSRHDGRVIYLFFGRLHEKKGCLELIRAWTTRCEADAHFAANSALVFAGWIDSAPGFLEAIAEAAERYGNVEYVGAQFGDDRARTYAAANWFVLPSKSEGLPMAVLEAWAAGVPVLMTSHCNLPRGFDQGAAIEIDTDEQSIAIGLARTAAMPSEAVVDMGRKGRALIVSDYSAERVGSDMLALYETVLSSR